MEHSKEPWEFCVSDDAYFDANGDFIGACTTFNDANARRIVACVNACAGVPIELLETNPAPFSELRAQRDKLLEALNIAEQFIQVASDWRIDEAQINGEMRATYEILDIVQTALANAKGEGWNGH